ncbi:MAG TPA: Gfo/Idh/MocA family oxidoreductase [Candidatus Limnocylindrales bacterium]|nr:Gfo/Idh/MocA family oxidoreductase [Candidatus Limnocylindrales bacterium]
MREIGVGVIGMGWMGDAHSRSYRLVADRFHERGIAARLVACADVDASRAEAARDRFGFERATTDWSDVMADGAVEAISITAPNDAHLAVIEAAVAAGKHVLCEKPVGRTPEETLAAAALARTSGLITFVGYNYRWAPVVQHARDLIAAGAIGELTHYRGRFLNGYAKDPNGVLSWRFRADQGHGTLSDLLSHAIDMAHLIAGPIEDVVGNRRTFIGTRPLPRPGGTHYDTAGSEDPRGEVTNEDYVGALVRFAGGAQGTLEACRVITGSQCDLAFEVHGTRGALAWTFERMNELRVFRRADANPADEGWTTELSGPAHPRHRAFNPGWGVGLGFDDLKVIEAAEFLTAIAAGQPAAPSFEDAAAVARVQQAIAASWDSSGWETVARD